MKRIPNTEIQMEVATYLGSINSIHCYPKQMKYILKQFTKPEKSISYIQTLLGMLNNIISGEHIQDFFFFDGQENSFISLKNTITYPVNSICMTGYIRFEGDALNRDQCIFSFLSEAEKEAKGVELFVKKKCLVYRTINSSKEVRFYEIPFTESSIKKDVWHHISLIHIGLELIIYLDDNMWKKNIIDNSPFAKTYNYAMIGASLDLKTCKPSNHFYGEMSTICFFQLKQNIKDAFKTIAFKENIWQYQFIDEDSEKPNFFTCPKWNKLNLFKELMQNAAIIIDPRVII